MLPSLGDAPDGVNPSKKARSFLHQVEDMQGFVARPLHPSLEGKHIFTEIDLPEVPEWEVLLLLKHADLEGTPITVVTYRSKTDKTKFGRVMITLHKGWEKIKGLQDDCPNFFQQMTVDKKHQESSVVMWSTGKAIGLHGDNRALYKATMAMLEKKGILLGRGFDTYMLKCIHGDGPIKGMWLTARNITGDPTHLSYSMSENELHNEDVVRGWRQGNNLPELVDMDYTIVRKAGQATIASYTSHSGAMGCLSDSTSGETTYASVWEEDTFCKRLQHSAYTDEGTYSLAVLGSIKQENIPHWLDALRALPLIPLDSSTEPMPAANCLKPAGEFYRTLHCRPVANNSDGMGNMGVEVHSLRCVGGDEANLSALGRVYKVEDGPERYKVVDPEEHGAHTSAGRTKAQEKKKATIWDTLAECPNHGWTVKTSMVGKNKRDLYYHALFTGHLSKKALSLRKLSEFLASRPWKDYMTQKKQQHPLWANGSHTLVVD